MGVVRAADFLGAINPLVRSTSSATQINPLAIAPTSTQLATAPVINPIAIAPPPTKDDLLGPGNTAPLSPPPPPPTTTSKVSTSLVSAPKAPAGSGLFDFGPGGPAPAPAPVPAGDRSGYDVERPEPLPPLPEPFPSGGGGGGGFVPSNAGYYGQQQPRPSSVVSDGGVPTWALAVGGLAVAGGAFLLWRRFR